jgi:glucokinase
MASNNNYFEKTEGPFQIPEDTKEIIGASDPNGTNTPIEFVAVNKEGKLTRVFFALCKSKKIEGDFSDVVSHAIDVAGLQGKVTRIVMSPAGPIVDNDTQTNAYCKLTYAPFFINASAAHIPTALINDFVAKGYAIGTEIQRRKKGLEGKLTLIPLFDTQDENIKPDESMSYGVIGPGTGLGRIIMDYDQETQLYTPAPKKGSEGGHEKLVPDTADETDIKLSRFLRERYCDGSAPIFETILCGDGVLRVFEYFKQEAVAAGPDKHTKEINRVDGTREKSVEIGKIAREDPNSLSGQAMKYFWKHLGDAAYNLAVDGNTRGGVYISGGVACGEVYLNEHDKAINPVLLQEIRKAFLDTASSHKTWLKKVPIYLVAERDLGLDGSRAVAANPNLFKRESPKNKD